MMSVLREACVPTRTSGLRINLLASGFFSLIKAPCERRLSVCRRIGQNSIEPRRERWRAAVREANAEVQSGSYFGCFNRPDAIASVVFHRMAVVLIVALLSSRHLARVDRRL